MKLRHLLFFGIALFSSLPGFSQNPTEMVKIEGGKFVPLYGVTDQQIQLENFYIDKYAVTHQQFVAFVKKYPKWSKSQVPGLFADKNYLSQWIDNETYPAFVSAKSPVNSVSWYAAKAYCECQGKRLPTLSEWEYTAMADETRRDARTDSLYNQRILTGYEKPKTHLKEVGSAGKNIWGVYDLHGLVWEWTWDFNSVLISGESRKDVDTDRNLFCAAGSVGATDLMNYAAFMRYAFRGSLKANYAVRNLGFRCAKD